MRARHYDTWILKSRHSGRAFSYFPNLNPEIFGPNPVSSPTHSLTYRSLDLLAASLPEGMTIQSHDERRSHAAVGDT